MVVHKYTKKLRVNIIDKHVSCWKYMSGGVEEDFGI